MFEVLLPVDYDDERTRAAAATVASLPNAAEEVQVTILNVETEMEVVDTEGGKMRSEEWYDETDYPSSVTEAKSHLEDAGITVETRREHADPAESILEVADELEADLIVMAGRKRTPAGKVLFGSITQSVLLNAETPVTVIME
ncbi:universal stress protein [Natrialbaceae archaeon A-gly3]